ITVSEIAEQADFNRGTFYTHYQDKIDLLEDLYTDALEGIRQSYVEPYKNMDRALIKDDDPSVSLIFKHIEKHKNLFQALDIIGGDPGIYNRLEEFLWNLFTKEIELEKHADATDIDYEILLSFQIH